MNADDDIPTLTDILKPGDPDMAQHFDAHCFDDSADTEATTPAEQIDIEKLVSETLDEMLPEFKQQLLARIQQKLVPKPD
jgi:hypothetical protein